MAGSVQMILTATILLSPKKPHARCRKDERTYLEKIS
jgi:hypothetical protein